MSPWLAAAAFALLLLARGSPGQRPGTLAAPDRAHASPRPAAPARSSLDRYALSDPHPAQVELPDELGEISGLAMTSDDRLFAHDDERGILYQIDYRTGRVVKWFALGQPPVHDDFEGVAIVGRRFFLMTSAGTLYETREGALGAAMPYTRYSTHLGRRCEVEGLAYDPDTQTLLLPCKTPRVPELAARLIIFAFRLPSLRLDYRPRFALPLAGLGRVVGRRGFHPTSVERDPRTGSFYVLSSRTPALVEISAAGVVLGGQRLPRSAHPQAEGVTVTRDRTLIIADEGRGGRGRITLYPAAGPAQRASSNANGEARP